jgi:phage gp36-like protein
MNTSIYAACERLRRRHGPRELEGLERFKAVFRDNGIDKTVLRHLTEDDPRELGLPLGARIKLPAAIPALEIGVIPELVCFTTSS